LDTQGKQSALKKLRQQLAQNKYDLVIDAHNNFRSHVLRKIPAAQVVKLKKYKWPRFFLVKFGWNFYRDVVPVYQRYINTVAAFGVKDDGLGLEFFPETTTRITVEAQLAQQGWSKEKLTIAVAPGASYTTKRWPVERFAHVCYQLAQKFDLQFLLLGDKHDAALTKVLKNKLGDIAFDVAGLFNLTESACALDCADFLLTNDTGLMHLGTALKKPVVAIFGSTVRELGFFPFGDNSIVIENEGLPCRPCSHVGKKSCPKKHFKCMMDIEPEHVLNRITSLVEQLSRT
jgi:heptosyltransferase-2